MTFKTRQQAAGYLGGMIDGEGTVTKPGRRAPRIRIANTNTSLIEAVGEALKKLDIESYYVRKFNRSGTKTHNPAKHKDCYDLEIWGVPAMVTILRECPVVSEIKRSRIEYATIDRRAEGLGSRKCQEGCTCKRHTWRKAAR